MRGAFPSVVIAQVMGTRFEALVKTSCQNDCPPEAEYLPELHPLDFEWYFTRDCASELARWFAGARREILCIGTPTVAGALATLGQRTRLLDRNPAVLLRFPQLRNSQSVYLNDIAQANEIRCRADVVILDAPWYLRDILAWVATAAQLVKPWGVVALSLFPPLVRPTAETERQKILDFLSGIGDTEVVEGALAYETPLFEREALRQTNLEQAGNWRRGDLVIVKVRHKISGRRQQLQIPADPDWRTFWVSGQVIKTRVRKRRRPDASELLAKVDGLTSFTYPTVSARDTHRDMIDLWTSRNRVAQVGDFGIVTNVLHQMQEGVQLSEALRRASSTQSPGRILLSSELKLREVLESKE